MRHSALAWLMVGTLGLVAGAHCGGKAVVDGPPPGSGGEGGEGASGGHTVTTTTTWTTTTWTTSTGTGTPGASPTGTGAGTGTGTGTGTGAGMDACATACQTVWTCNYPDDCIGRCELSSPGCKPQQESWLWCLAGSLQPGMCDPPQQCAAQYDAWRSCAVQQSGPSACGIGSDGSCGCSANLWGGDGYLYETSCQSQGGTSQCRCTVDGYDVGSCIDPVAPIEACDPFTGCCSVLFFVPFGPPMWDD